MTEDTLAALNFLIAYYAQTEDDDEDDDDGDDLENEDAPNNSDE